MSLKINDFMKLLRDCQLMDKGTLTPLAVKHIFAHTQLEETFADDSWCVRVCAAVRVRDPVPFLARACVPRGMAHDTTLVTCTWRAGPAGRVRVPQQCGRWGRRHGLQRVPGRTGCSVHDQNLHAVHHHSQAVRACVRRRCSHACGECAPPLLDRAQAGRMAAVTCGA